MFDDVKKYIGQNIVGNENNLRISLAAVLCGGHILIEDLPGTGKTTFAKMLAKEKYPLFSADLVVAKLYKNNFFINILIKKFSLKKKNKYKKTNKITN